MQHGAAIITGAGSGIGRAAAIEVTRRGYPVVLAGRRADLLRETAALCGGRAMAVRCDVTNPDECATLIGAAIDGFGGVDALINNAGLAPSMGIEKHTPEIIHEVFASNALGAAYLIAAVWPHWQKRSPPTAKAPGPVLINVSSMATKDPLPGLFAYAAAKAGVNLMVRSAHNEGRAFGVRAFAIAPGAVETDMLRGILSKEQLPTERTLSPRAVAMVIGACIGGERDAESGSVLYLPSP